MKKLFLFSLLTLATGQVSAFTINDNRTSIIEDEARKDDMRKQIGLDYSMPDFNTSSINGKVIGMHLAEMLDLLVENYKDYTYNPLLARLLNEQEPSLQYAFIEKLKIQNISKSGNEIGIKIKLTIKPNSLGITNSVIIMKFVDGISESSSANDLFWMLSRHATNK